MRAIGSVTLTSVDAINDKIVGRYDTGIRPSETMDIMTGSFIACSSLRDLDQGIMQMRPARIRIDTDGVLQFGCVYNSSEMDTEWLNWSAGQQNCIITIDTTVRIE